MSYPSPEPNQPIPSQSMPDQPSLGQLVGEIGEDLSRLFRQELELAKVEVQQEATKAGKAAKLLGGAGLAGHMAALLGTLAVMFGLSNVMDLGWAALIVAVVWAVIAAVLYTTGRARLREVSPKPEQTVETLKEDAQWARDLKK